MPSSFSNDNAIYSVDMMFAFLIKYKHPITKIKMDEMLDLLNVPVWGDPTGTKYSAMDVINFPTRYALDYKRIIKANLSYPIIVSYDDGYIEIVDGMHRLAKAFLQGKKEIDAYFFDKDLMDKFKLIDISRDDQDLAWEQVDSLQPYQIINLYNERFCTKNFI